MNHSGEERNMDTNTANTMKHTVDVAVAQGLPVILEVGEKLPEIAPIVARNAEGAVQAGKTALNLLKGAGVALGTGVLFGSGTLLFVGGFVSVFWAAGKAKDGIERKMEERRAKKAREAIEAKKQTTGTPAPQPA